MSADANLGLTCLVVDPNNSVIDLSRSENQYEGFLHVRAIHLAAEHVGIELQLASKVLEPVKTPYSLELELSKVSLVLVEVSDADPLVYFYLGLARAFEKTLITLRRFDGVPLGGLLDQCPGFHLEYEAHARGIEDLQIELRETFSTIRRREERERELHLGGGPIALDWDRLSATQYENICFELLLQRDFREATWLENTEEIKILALRKRTGESDPAGNRTEVFLIAIGDGLADDFTVRLWDADFAKIRPQVKELVDKVRKLEPEQISVRLSFLFVWSPKADLFEVQEDVWKELTGKIARRATGLPVRFGGGVWRRKYVEQLVRANTTLLEKYFSDHVEEQTDRHKSMIDLYHEARRQKSKVIVDRRSSDKEEWQEKAYTVTHSIGNAIFPVETYVDYMRDTFKEMDFADGVEAAEKAMVCLEKAKVQIKKFKGIASLKDPKLVPTDPMPPLRVALDVAQRRGVEVNLWEDFEGQVPLVIADKDMLEEALDELVTNSLHWILDREEKKIDITLRWANPGDLTDYLADSDERFLWLRFQDSGPGVKNEHKQKIFDLFFSRRPTGMGFGLATVAKNVRGFGGDIVETGTPGSGVQFDIFLPISS